MGKIDSDTAFASGYLIRPTVITNIADDASLMARANKTQFGLGGSVWGRDTEKALAVARRIKAGQVWVNAHGVLAHHLAPYGGVKQSGIGRKSGIEGILEYVQSQTITTYEHA
jgi:acyl-CoA reductase-like NAD-dependent aldehyde dehydrogenase